MGTEPTIETSNREDDVSRDWLAEGEAFYKERQYKESLKCFQQAVARETSNPRAWFLHSQALVMCLKYPEAVESCKKALELDPKNADTWFLKSFAHGVLGEYEEGLQSATKGLEINPDNKMVWSTKGQYLYALGRLEEALESFGTALKMSPDNEYFKEVTEKITKWLRRDGQSKEWADQIIHFLQEGGFQEALSSYKQSLQVDPRSTIKVFDKNYALAHLENPEKMLKDFEQTKLKDQPQIIVEIAQKEFEFSREAWVEVTLTNKGKSSAKDLTYSFSSEVTIKKLDVSPEMLQRLRLGDKTASLDVISELAPGNQTKQLISITPAKLGQIALEVQLFYTDAWGSKQNKTTVCWISVFKPGGQLPAISGYKTMWRLSVSETASIYVAQRTSDNTRVVMKIPQFTPDQTSLITEFLNEIKQIAKLVHPNIIRILQYGESPSPWIIVEYMPKGTLTRRFGRLTIHESIQTGIKLADALAFARTFRISHRNITSDNVLFDDKDNPKLINWRIGTITQKLRKNTSIYENVNVYYPPEKLTSGFGGADFMSDIYQLGVLLYQMLTEQPPFQGEGEQLISNIVEKLPLEPSILNSSINKDLNKLVMTCLAKNKKDRYQNASQIKTELQQISKNYT